MIKAIFLFFWIIAEILSAQTYSISSPGNIIQINFLLEEGTPYYTVSRFNNEVITKSKLGFKIKDSEALESNFTLSSHFISSFDETWTQVWGEKKEIRNNYTELLIDLIEKTGLKRQMRIIFRAFDDGIGFKYEIPEQEGIKKFEITDELTEFNVTGNHKCWSIGAYQWHRYEYLYEETFLSDIDTVHTPVTMETKDGIYLSFHEAALYDYPGMAIERIEGNRLKANLFPWSDGVKVRTSAPMISPWRTIQIADNPGRLITSYLILNLNEPNKLEDVSWIKPGKYIGIWWGMHIGKYTWGSGPLHGATTANTKRYIDFAAQYGFDGVLVEGWNTGWDGDWGANGEIFNFTTPYPDFDIEEVTKYAEEKGVRLIGHHETGAGIRNYERQMKDAFALYERLGVRAVKTGYVGHGQNVKRYDEQGNVHKEWHHGQFMVRHYQKVVEEAAKHKIMLDVHEPIKDTGIRRTWPNMMTREGARGQEWDAWGPDGGNPPEHTTILPFTRFLSGPMDFTPGIFGLLFEDEPPDNRVNTTLAKQLAHYVILYSPLQMAADLPENYEANLKPFQFIIDVPCDWEDTKVLNASIGDYVTMVRKDRNSEDWYLGSITDEQGRIFEIPLNFLSPKKKYKAEIYKDGLNAEWRSNPFEIDITSEEVSSDMTLKLRLAPGGGQAIRFKALN